MRVVHVIKATGLAGAERHLLDLLPALRARGWDARLLVLLDHQHPPQELFDEAARREIPTSRLPIRHHLDPGLRARLVRHFKAERPDIVHTHLLHADLYGIGAARRAGVPVVVSTRHDELAFRRRWPFRWLHRRLWAQADGGIAVSKSILRFCREVEGSRTEMRVIHHGIATVHPEPVAEARAALGLAVGGAVVGLVCRLNTHKGAAVGLDAFAALAEEFPSATLLIVGEGPLRAALERRVASGGLQDQVRFLGWRTDTQRIYSALDVLIAPSLYEGFGLTVLEAMAHGVAVLAFRVGALPELVADDETGLLVSPGEQQMLREELRRLLADAALRERLGAAGAARARLHFALERMVCDTLGLYGDLAAQKGHAPRLVPEALP